MELRPGQAADNQAYHVGIAGRIDLDGSICFLSAAYRSLSWMRPALIVGIIAVFFPLAPAAEPESVHHIEIAANVPTVMVIPRRAGQFRPDLRPHIDDCVRRKLDTGVGIDQCC